MKTTSARLAAVWIAAIAASGCARNPTPASSVAPAAGDTRAMRWIATWSPSASATAARPAAGTPDRVPTYANATIRQVIHTTIGGDHIRIRISNEYGDKPLVIGSVHVARRTTGSSIDATTDRTVTFGGNASTVVRTGATVTSDPLTYDVPQLGDLAISMFLPDSARTTTRHALAVATTYVSKQGDLTANAAFTADTTMRSWIFLMGVDVTNSRAVGAIVTIGNSITDGAAATADSNRRWPDVLARRLLGAKGEPVRAVINAGISGNRVLTFGAGPSLVSRFDRDVLMVPGVTHVIILEGINDIGRAAPSSEAVTADEIIFAYKQVIDRAHERGLIIYGATLTPYDRLPTEGAAKREKVNGWIRTSGAFDGVIDFEAATRDPANPTGFLPAYDSGDHLHPSDAGYKAMGESIDLKLFRRTR